MPKQISIIGQTFGKLKVLSQAESRIISGVPRIYYLCECECGKQIEILGSSLRAKASQSCGCGMPEATRQRFLRHGHAVKSKTTSRTYNSWTHMKSRCQDVNHHQYKDWGGRGIVVCQGFQSFPNFFERMGERPPKMTIDRINNEGNYSCGGCAQCKEKGWLFNCKWSTTGEQRRNARTTHWVTLNDFHGCFQDAAEHFGIPISAAASRYRYGWTYEEIFLTPVRKW